MRLTSPVSVREFLEEVYANDRLVTASSWRSTCRTPGSPVASTPWRRSLSGRLNVDVRDALRRVRHPMLIVWGDHARRIRCSTRTRSAS